MQGGLVLRFGFGGRVFANASRAERDSDDFGEEERGEAHVPDPANGELHGSGIEGPEPSGPESDLFAASALMEAAGGDLVDDGGGCGGEDAVDDEEHPGGRGGVDAEDFEDSCDEERVEGGRPRRGPGVSGKGIGKAVASGEGSGDTAHLPAELEVIFFGADAIGVDDGDVEDADEEASPEHGGWRPEEGGFFSGPGGFHALHRR